MEEEVRKDVLDVLDRVIEILRIEEEQDAVEIKELSNHVIHDASIYHDEASISLAVVIYAISKMLERHADVKEVYSTILLSLKKAKDLLEKNDADNYLIAIKNLIKRISELDVKLKEYIMEVIEKAKIKKGSKIYEHGVSIGRAAEILGVSQWDLMSYIGKTEVVEEAPKITSTKERLSYARRLFGI